MPWRVGATIWPMERNVDVLVLAAAGPVRPDRTSPNDLMHLAYDRGAAPAQVGAVLILEAASGLDRAKVRAVLAARIVAVPRLRQRLHRAPAGCGRPFWADDPDFEIERHVNTRLCPAPADERALLDLAADLVATRLPPDRPLWSATVVEGLASGCAAVIVVLHHVIADGLGALAILANLVDGTPGGLPSGSPGALPSGAGRVFPQRQPTRRELAAQAWQGRVRAVGAAGPWLGLLIHALAELRVLRSRSAQRSSLTRPTGPKRRLAVARADLDAIRAAGRAAGGTVNDVALAAVGGAVDALLRHRGESIDRLVVSVLVAGRTTVSAEHLGNQVGIARVAVPTAGPAADRLRRVAELTTAGRSAVRGASAVLLEPLFRLLAFGHLAQWFFNHQRRIHTFETNLRGPATRVEFLGIPVAEMIPVTGTSGNATVAFAVLSYAGSVTVTVVADPEVCPDFELLGTLLQRELDLLTGAVGQP